MPNVHLYLGIETLPFSENKYLPIALIPLDPGSDLNVLCQIGISFIVVSIPNNCLYVPFILVHNKTIEFSSCKIKEIIPYSSGD